MRPAIDRSEATLTGELLRLVEQAAWANRRWVEFVHAQADPETRPRELLGHVMIAERIWFDRIAGEPRVRATFPVLDRDELLRDFEENRATLRRLIVTRLEDVVDFVRASGEAYHARVVDIVHHVLTHGYHHRGQLAAHYARKGVAYPNTDHIEFLRERGL